MKKALIFPGQGSQFKGMGKGLFEKYPEIKIKAREILGYDLEALCLEDKDDLLAQTQYTQPAIFTVSAMHYWEYLKENPKPDFLAGHSLGEYNALLASGVFDFETGLRLVHKRGALMAAASGGGMAAILGTSAEKLKKLLAEGGFDGIDIANYNTTSQIVIAGQAEDIRRAVTYFEEQKIQAIPLQVSAPFHSRYMKNAALEFEQFISGVDLNPLHIPVVANTTANWYTSAVKETLGSQIAQSVRWVDSIRFLMGNEVTEFKEIGGHILTRMVADIKKNCSPLTHHKSSVLSGNEKKVFLGSKDFCRDYNIKLPYVAGGMYRGVASPEMVIRLGKAKMFGFYGTGGLQLNEIENGIRQIKTALNNGESFGINLLHHFGDPETEWKLVDLYLKENIKYIEASAFMQMTKPLVYFRVKGLGKDAHGNIISSNQIMAKISRPEVAEVFMNPAPERILKQLIAEGKITEQEAEMAREVPVSQDICVEADSGGHTDAGRALVILPAIRTLRDQISTASRYSKPIRIGLAGGIGTPESVVCAFMMGADFVLTGSINQCTVEAGTSDLVKDLLQEMNVQDTDYAPAGDMFEIGAKVQVLKKGVLFSPRANKLYTLYNHYESLDELPVNIRKQLEESYFKKNLDEIWQEVKNYQLSKGNSSDIEKAEKNGKQKMAMVFKWYFGFSSRSALNGFSDRRVDFQIHTGPALGAFNQWVKGTGLESWRARHVDQIGEKLMHEATLFFEEKVNTIYNN
ncbi:[acyl-carrier-protein] S-malonyltransferase [Chryseobacterium pennae]|uniref:[acyl-carrier-protein] S-malonyltransferase n=1 Tax=Chryseobacterium pennae TaxID=2258962 RepID=A0A3D9C5M4_9FLAO|nr:ACP S-malonyltransferase [Chryseobacterium pennae]REC60781.1 [acyl-carrier-protein] S-malonyltransferase [Chryseobacterium pennae]